MGGCGERLCSWQAGCRRSSLHPRIRLLCSRLGWGYFLVRAEVTLRPEWGGETLRLSWLLDFDGERLEGWW